MKITKPIIAGIVALTIPFAGVSAAFAKESHPTRPSHSQETHKPVAGPNTKHVLAPVTNETAIANYATAKAAYDAAIAADVATPTKATAKAVKDAYKAAEKAYEDAQRSFKANAKVVVDAAITAHDAAVAAAEAAYTTATTDALTVYNTFIANNPDATVEELAANAATYDAAVTTANDVKVAAVATADATLATVKADAKAVVDAAKLALGAKPVEPVKAEKDKRAKDTKPVRPAGDKKHKH